MKTTKRKVIWHHESCKSWKKKNVFCYNFEIKVIFVYHQHAIAESSLLFTIAWMLFINSKLRSKLIKRFRQYDLPYCR